MLFSKAFITWFNNQNNPWNTAFHSNNLISYKVILKVKVEENKIYKVARHCKQGQAELTTLLAKR